MMAKLLEIIGGVIMAAGVLVFAANRYGRLEEILPQVGALQEYVIPLFLGGGALVLVSKGLERLAAPRLKKKTLPPQDQHVEAAPMDHETIEAMAKAAAAHHRQNPPPKGPRQTRSRLCASVPQTPTKCWIGGTPHLPDDVEWPYSSGAPAIFVAQIGISDLPATVFGGALSRDTSLVIFIDHDYTETKVLFVSGPLSPKQQPLHGRKSVSAKKYQILWSEHDEILAPFVPEIGHERPRWYLDVTVVDEPIPPFADDDARLAANDATYATRRAWFEGFDQLKPQYQPFDWPSAKLCLNQITTSFCEAVDNPKSLENHKTEAEKTEFLERAELRKQQLSELIEEIGKLADTEPFDTVQRDALNGALRAMPLTQDRFAAHYDKGLIGFGKGQTHAQAYESLARRAYTHAPEILPEAVRTPLETIWAATAANEPVFVGDSVSEGGPMSTYPVLLDLPTSDLTGMHFGDVSRWILEVPLTELVEGKTVGASARTTHGQ